MALTVDSFRLIMEDFLPGLKKVGDVLSIIGLLYTAKIATSLIWDLLTGIRAHFWSRLWKRNLIQRYGKWAMVTGCTDGIGKGYARELAKEGMNIILVSRSFDKLVTVAKDIEKDFRVETIILEVDFKGGREIYEEIEKKLSQREIGILVNNVGVMLSHPKKFGEISQEELWAHINVNMSAVTALTHIILPGMLDRKKGAIVNVASIAGSGPIPLLGIYAASKAYVDYLSQSLQNEYAGSGITVQTVNPSYVSTNMTNYSRLISTPSLLIPTAPTFASSALNTLGYTKRTTGYYTHGIQKWFLDNFVPTWMFTAVMKLSHQIILWDYKRTNKNA